MDELLESLLREAEDNLNCARDRSEYMRSARILNIAIALRTTSRAGEIQLGA